MRSIWPAMWSLKEILPSQASMYSLKGGSGLVTGYTDLWSRDWKRGEADLVADGLL